MSSIIRTPEDDIEDDTEEMFVFDKPKQAKSPGGIQRLLKKPSQKIKNAHPSRSQVTSGQYLKPLRTGANSPQE